MALKDKMIMQFVQIYFTSVITNHLDIILQFLSISYACLELEGNLVVYVLK